MRFLLRTVRRALVTSIVLAILLPLIVVWASDARADGLHRSLVMTSPAPSRGYWLPGETVEFQAVCAPGESRIISGTEGWSSAGWSSTSGVGFVIDLGAPPGIHEVRLECHTVGEGLRTFTEALPVTIGPALSLRATVGTDADICATTSELTVSSGTVVYWCYTLTPHPELDPALGSHLLGVPFDGYCATLRHEIRDAATGAFGAFVMPCVDGRLVERTSLDLGLISSGPVTAPISSDVTWEVMVVGVEDGVLTDAYDIGSWVVQLSASASVQVAGAPPSLPTIGLMEASSPVVRPGDNLTVSSLPGSECYPEGRPVLRSGLPLTYGPDPWTVTLDGWAITGEVTDGGLPPGTYDFVYEGECIVSAVLDDDAFAGISYDYEPLTLTLVVPPGPDPELEPETPPVDDDQVDEPPVVERDPLPPAPPAPPADPVPAPPPYLG